MEKILEELKKLKEKIIFIHQNKDKIVSKYGSINNYYLSVLKNEVKKDFPYITEFIKLRRNAVISGNVDQFYIDLFCSTKEKAIELYGSFSNAILKAPIDLFTLPEEKVLKEKEIKNIITFMMDYRFYPGFFANYCEVANKYVHFYESENIPRIDVYPTRLTNEQIVMYARKIIEDIDPKLVEDFDNLLNSNAIKFTSKPYKINNTSSLNRKKDKRDYLSYDITLDKRNSYYDICVLVHEFMHYVIEKSYNVVNDYLVDEKKRYLINHYTEFVSIYFEDYAKEYLMKRHDIPREEFDNYSRINSNYDCAYSAIYQYLPFLMMRDYNEISFEVFKKIVDDYSLIIEPTKDNYNNVQKLFLKTFKIINDIIKYGQSLPEDEMRKYYISNYADIELCVLEIVTSYPHFLSTFLAKSAKKELTKSDVLNFIKLLQTKSYDEILSEPLYEKIQNLYSSTMEGDDKAFHVIDDDIVDDFGHNTNI